jgi:hypothetical protein
MSTYTIELSEYQGSPGASNGEWYNQIQSKVVLEDGDMLQIKQALINTQASTNTGISVEEDTVAHITFGFYDNAVTGLTAKYPMLPPIMQSSNVGNNPYTYRDNVFNGATTYVPPWVESNGTLVTAGKQYSNTPWVAVEWDGAKYTRRTVTVVINIPQGIYSSDELGDLITREMQLSETFVPFDTHLAPAVASPADGPGRYSFFCYPPHYPTVNGKTELVYTSNEFMYQNQFYNYDTDLYGSYMAGAPSPALSYQNDRFQFTYLHTPILLNANGKPDTSPWTEIGASNYKADDEVRFLSRYSGLYIIDMTVHSGQFNFWEVMGFSQSSFVDDDCSNIEDFTTTCFINEGSYVNKNFSLPVQPSIVNDQFNFFITSDVSTSITALSDYQYDLSGYYLINVISSFNNKFITENDVLSKVACVCSKQYQAGDYITAYSDSSIVYQHSGDPIMVGYFQVQIIEPKTGVVANDLGANSSIFLEIVKAPPQQQAIKGK